MDISEDGWNNSCVIIDAYRFSSDLSKLIKQKGYQCIHVQSTSLPAVAMVQPLDFTGFFDHPGITFAKLILSI